MQFFQRYVYVGKIKCFLTQKKLNTIISNEYSLKYSLSPRLPSIVKLMVALVVHLVHVHSV